MSGTRLVTVLIADDEPIARAGLRAMLASVEWATCIGEASNGPAARDAINSLRPELVFLNIEILGLLGTIVMRCAEHHRPLNFCHHVSAARSDRVRARRIRQLSYGR